MERLDVTCPLDCVVEVVFVGWLVDGVSGLRVRRVNTRMGRVHIWQQLLASHSVT